MTRWFRHYAGMSRDEKLVSVAIKSRQTIERVIWVWGAILESAAEIDDAGIYRFDEAEAAYFLRADEADILAIVSALEASGRLAGGCVVKWGNRQFSSDRSKERVAAYRERKRSERVQPDVIPPSRNGDVTLQSRHGNAPETETETEIQEDTSLRSVSKKPGAAEARIAEPKPPDKTRGERLPENWHPGSNWLEFTRQEGLTDDDARRELDGFRDYWRGVPGASGRKLDWLGTWRNCVRRAASRGQRGARRPTAAGGGQQPHDLLSAVQRAAGRFRASDDVPRERSGLFDGDRRFLELPPGGYREMHKSN